jgi:hypothetical protein
LNVKELRKELVRKPTYAEVFISVRPGLVKKIEATTYFRVGKLTRMGLDSNMIVLSLEPF